MESQTVKPLLNREKENSNITLHGLTECSRCPEIRLIISKINVMEDELEDLKNTLQAYINESFY